MRAGNDCVSRLTSTPHKRFRSRVKLQRNGARFSVVPKNRRVKSNPRNPVQVPACPTVKGHEALGLEGSPSFGKLDGTKG